MIQTDDGKGFLEIFTIDAESFKLRATLTSLKNGKSRVQGWFEIESRDRSRFHREDEDRTTLRRNLLSVCVPIAALYGGEVKHRKIKTAAQKKGDPFLLRPEGRMVH